jgi:hypothetical protein
MSVGLGIGLGKYKPRASGAPSVPPPASIVWRVIHEDGVDGDGDWYETVFINDGGIVSPFTDQSTVGAGSAGYIVFVCPDGNNYKVALSKMDGIVDLFIHPTPTVEAGISTKAVQDDGGITRIMRLINDNGPVLRIT